VATEEKQSANIFAIAVNNNSLSAGAVPVVL
jgi:hypothetical protein